MNRELFNTPFELSLHVVLLLGTIKQALSVERIVAYDFIAVYPHMFNVSDENLNGENEFTFSELTTRRNLIKTAVKSLVLDRLILATDTNEGTLYDISESGQQLYQSLTSEYAVKYKKIINLVQQKYEAVDDIHLQAAINMCAMNDLRR